MEKSKKRLIISLCINLLIVVFEIIGVVLSIRRRGLSAFLFYTEITNYLTLIISLIYVIFCFVALKLSNKIPNWVYGIRYMSTVCLMITLSVVLFVLIPMMPNSTLFFIFGDSNLYQHFFCPILTIISFMFFESERKLNKNISLLGIFPTLVYGLIMLCLNLCKVIVGPYPFFYVYDLPWYATLLFLLGILIVSYLIAFIVRIVHNKIYKKCILDFGENK